eukprot:CAMPEP_0194239290 /NCGR_PEP_ID=MMETSP0158-20130606/5802_1 /TAXON_ID=33649 /ORGANISM="Thalassionema nitzschioides, Strain L26-B" /LENGTH=151 /DNA_ID=CAMNT_0038973731 /DNA_START=20 /DNA_END=475 /DNA_ORIENTATION=-
MATASSDATEDEEEGENSWIQQALNQQYEHLELYCNAQTRLQNSLLQQQLHRQHNDTRTEWVMELSHAVQDVQQDLETLRNHTCSHPRKQELLQRHVELSERVIKTIYEHGGMYHRNGIPATKDNIEIKTVALASLRARSKHLGEVFGVSS